MTNEAGNPVAQLRFGRAVSADDPLSLFSALLTKARTIWMRADIPLCRVWPGCLDSLLM